MKKTVVLIIFFSMSNKYKFKGGLSSVLTTKRVPRYI